MFDDLSEIKFVDTGFVKPCNEHFQYWIKCSDEFELKFPELSQAELKSFQAESRQAGHFNFQAETELNFLAFLAPIFFLVQKLVVLRKKRIICHKENQKSSENAWEIRKKCLFSDFRAEQKMSRAELKILQLELWPKPTRLGLITSKL